jgi:two-component system cell cycle sensor histidine kinase/response regulator CckA
MMTHEEPDARTLMVLGRLAGGVAHDFNNQLTSIIGYADLMLAEMREDDPARFDVIEIRRAAERAHMVTRHLAAFARPQPAQPVVLNVAHTLTANVRLIKRILGDDVQLTTIVDDAVVEREPALVRADPGHLGRMLICLAVRAREAMAHGGGLTIAIEPQADGIGLIATTSEAEADAPRQRQDSGDTELSMIEDLVRLCGGELLVEAERVIIRLPRADTSESAGVVESAPPTGDEDVLIVEDDGGVRELVGTVLERKGYHVTRVERPSQALAVAQSSRRIDLAIVDVILPEQRGDALAAELARVRPGLRVLFMSGHTAREIGDVATGARGIFLHKPFTPHELLVRVRQALDNTPNDSPNAWTA